jgi:signal transduction histidine kinase
MAVGADAGALALVHGPSSPSTGAPAAAAPDAAPELEFEIVRRMGYPEPLATRYQRFPVAAGGPLSDAVLTRTPRLLGSWAAWHAAYPDADADMGALGFEAFAAIPVLSSGHVLAALSASFRRPVAFTEETRTFLATLGEQCGLALARARAAEAERRARQASAFLAEAGQLLAASLDYQQTLRTVAEAAVPQLGDWCAVDVVRDPNVPTWPPDLERVAVVHRDPVKLALGADLTARYPTDWSAESGMAAVLRTGTPFLLPVITEAMLVAGARDAEHLALLRALEFSSILVVPLLARGRTLGALTLCHTESGRRYDTADLALAQGLAQRAALAVDNARLFRDAERARDVAEAASRTKGEFLAVMSHELRTPLNAIGGHVQLLDMGLHGPVTDEQRAALARVDRAQHHLLGLINDILNYARVESGRVEYDVQPVEVADVLREVGPMIHPQLAAKGLAYEVRVPESREVPGAPLQVWADREKLAQILLNLLSNAVKFTPASRDGAPGRVLVELSQSPAPSEAAARYGGGAHGGVAGEPAEGSAPTSPAHMFLRVTDTGVGIPATKLGQVFEPFVQVRTALTREVGGTGLGLAISRDLARGMGGDLLVASTEGVGSTFTLVLRRVIAATGDPVDRRTGEQRRLEEERRSGAERREEP